VSADRKSRGSRSPIFVLTCARSGSTLLHYILDSHPQIVSPPELGVSSIVQAIQGAWLNIKDPETLEARRKMGIAESRRTLGEMIDWYLKKSGKERFCDKSLTTNEHADALAMAFPEAQFIVLYRHCMDMIASGVDASRWGYAAFGFLPYIQAFPGNTAAALATYWCDRTEMAAAFESTHGDRCFRIYYELLVKEPMSVLGDLFQFLRVREQIDSLESALSLEHGSGPGDYEVDMTTEIHNGSIGRGAGVPVTLIPPALLQRVNSLLNGLGYPAVGSDWNTEPSPLLIRNTSIKQSDFEVANFLEQSVAKRVSRMTSLLSERERISIGLTVEGGSPTTRWVLDFASGIVYRGEAATTVRAVIREDALWQLRHHSNVIAEVMLRGDLRLPSKEGSEVVRKIAAHLLESAILDRPSSSVADGDVGVMSEDDVALRDGVTP
jgi:protein-tyrosine sulfotransferase